MAGHSTLLAIATCNDPRFVERAQAQKETWAGTVLPQLDVKFFRGAASQIASEQDVVLDVDDRYQGLPAKVQAICRYAIEHGYERLFKTDDDTYVVPEHLVQQESAADQYQYLGKVRNPSGGYAAPYCSGYAYWLGRQAMEIIANASLTADTNEDRWVGNTLADVGIFPGHDSYSYRHIGSVNPVFIWRHTSVVGYASVFAELEPAAMRECHKHFVKWFAGYKQCVRKPKGAIVHVTD